MKINGFDGWRLPFSSKTEITLSQNVIHELKKREPLNIHQKSNNKTNSEKVVENVEWLTLNRYLSSVMWKLRK